MLAAWAEPIATKATAVAICLKFSFMGFLDLFQISL
jgi:hypothetical protein